MNCPRCSLPTRTVSYNKQGEARCPSCVAKEHYDINPATAIVKDGIPGGMWLENGFKTPVKVYSYSEAHALHAAAGLHEKEKFCPAPGTDIDPQGIPNPKGYVDAQTLENGRVLLLRQQKAPAAEWDGVEAGVLRDVKVGTLTERDAAAIAGGDRQRQSRFHRRTV